MRVKNYEIVFYLVAEGRKWGLRQQEFAVIL
jgi:hypothetical protein